MPIGIQCAACHRPYAVDERLAGKTLRCKGCGAAIVVPVPVSALAPDMPPEPDLLALGDAAAADNAAGSVSGAVLQNCPSCGAPVTSATPICLACGFNLVTRKKSVLAEIPLASDSDEVKSRRKRYLRATGNKYLEQADLFIKLALALALLVGLVVWFVHLALSPLGLSRSSLVPVPLLIALISGVLAPLTSLAINMAERMLGFVPRRDTYARLSLTLLFPLSVSLLFCWTAVDGRIGGFALLAWLLLPFLLIYILRGEPVDWVASVITAGIGIGIGSLLILLLGSGIARMTGPLYADAMPVGPWTILASGLSPAPPASPASTPALAAADEKAPLPASHSAPPTPSSVEATPALAAAPARTVAPPASAASPSNPPPTTPPIDATVNQARPAVAAAPRIISSPFLSNVLSDEPGFQGISDAAVNNDRLLLLKHHETTTAIERWTFNPPNKTGEMTYPHAAAKPSTFLLSPNGEMLVTLVQFPRVQLEVASFDGKTPRKIQSLDSARGTPSLVGFLDPVRFVLRCDPAGQAHIEYYNSLTGQPMHELTAQPLNPDPNAMAISPNGRYLAALGADSQIAIYNVDARTTTPVRKIPVSNNLPFNLVRLCFSPDSSQIAVYAVVSGVPAVQAFRVPTGEPTYRCVVSRKPHLMVESPGGAIAGEPGRPDEQTHAQVNHELLWLQDGKYWLVNGTDFIDVTTGRKIGSWELDNVIDQQLVGADSIMFVQGCGDNARRLVIAKLNEAQLAAAAKSQ